MSPEKHVRLFYAIPVSGEVAKLAAQLRADNPDLESVRWTPLANLHMTLFFLGDVPLSLEQEFLSILPRVSSAVTSFGLGEGRLSVMDARRKSSGMIWIKFNRNPAFQNLHEILHQAASAIHPVVSHYAEPVPHITLARFRNNVSLRMTETIIPALLCDRAELWKSVSTPNGVRYESLGGSPLQALL
jgi:RNA 2',3'-cyclic 3'-phosphodiesterase